MLATRVEQALRQIAIITGCIPDVPEQLNDKQSSIVIKWLQENHPNTYLWAIAQLCVGHPATVWGTKYTDSRRVMPKIAGSY